MRRIGLVMMAVVLCGWVHAAEEAPAGTNRTVITSDTLEFDYKRSIALFEGNVLVDDHRVKMKADKLAVIFDKDRAIRSLTAVGHVRVMQEDRVAHCNKAVYVAVSGEIVLTGEAKLSRGNDFVQGDRITFNVADERMRVEPGYLVVHPDAAGSVALEF